jgi:hypothetical protein
MMPPLSATMDEVWHGLPVSLVCTPHKAVACGTCCTDFTLLNQLRGDGGPNTGDAYLDMHARNAWLDEAIEQYFDSPNDLQHGTETVLSASPRIWDMLAQFQTAGGQGGVTQP